MRAPPSDSTDPPPREAGTAREAADLAADVMAEVLHLADALHVVDHARAADLRRSGALVVLATNEIRHATGAARAACLAEVTGSARDARRILVHAVERGFLFSADVEPAERLLGRITEALSPGA